MTAVDPRTILANALGYLRDEANGWTRHTYGWANHHTDTSIGVDRVGIDLADRHGMDTLAEWSDDETPSATAARAVDKLCADGVLPHRLSTGYQLAAQQWAQRVAEAEEARRLADQQIKELAKQLRTLANNSVGVLIDQAAEVQDLRQQLADATAHTPGQVAA